MKGDCLRSRELWTDLVEGSLPPPLERPLRNHLNECEECANLFASFRRVVEALRELEAPDAPAGLSDRILARTRPALGRVAALGRPREPPSPFPTGWAATAGWIAAAAVVAIVLFWRPPSLLSGVSEHVSHEAHRAYSFGVRAYHQTARWLEDLNVLRMTVGVAFEHRLDRLNERLRDLEEARRRTSDEPAPEQSSRPGRGGGELAEVGRGEPPFLSST